MVGEFSDVFIGSSESDNDVLDAREAHTLSFTDASGSFINVTGKSEI